MSNWTQTAEAHDVEKGQLRAIIFYSDRSWTYVTVYGPQTVANVIAKRDPPWGKSKVTRKNTSELPKVLPSNEGYVRDATDYGLRDGKVLLVPAELLG